jgi:hypothetical protein
MATRNRFLEISDRLTERKNSFTNLSYRGQRTNLNHSQAQWSLPSSKKLQKHIKNMADNFKMEQVDPDIFVLDVLQFFFEERLEQTQLNDHLRRLAATALSEAINASSKLDFVPRPPSLPPSIKWLIGQAVQIAFRKLQKEQGIYEIVRVTVKAKLRSEYELAKMDVGGALSFRTRAMSVNKLSTSPQGLEFLKQFIETNGKEDVKSIEQAINDNTTIALDQNQFDALVSFILNISIQKFINSTLLKFLNTRDYPKVVEEIRKWTKVEGKDDPELISRRNAEAELFQSGSYSAARSVFLSYKAFAVAKSLPKLSRAQNPALIIAGAGLGFTIFKGISDNRGDVTWNLSKVDGQKCPNDDEAKYKNKAVWQEKSFEVVQRTEGIGGLLPMSATFEVKFKYNGYGVGFISMQFLRSEDAMGWGLNVDASIMGDPNNYSRDDGELMSSFDITFNYRFSTSIPFRDDDVWIGNYKIYGDGKFVTISDKWTSPP